MLPPMICFRPPAKPWASDVERTTIPRTIHRYCVLCRPATSFPLGLMSIHTITIGICYKVDYFITVPFPFASRYGDFCSSIQSYNSWLV